MMSPRATRRTGTVEQLREPAQRIADRIDELMKSSPSNDSLRCSAQNMHWIGDESAGIQFGHKVDAKVLMTSAHSILPLGPIGRKVDITHVGFGQDGSTCRIRVCGRLPFRFRVIEVAWIAFSAFPMVCRIPAPKLLHTPGVSFCSACSLANCVASGAHLP